MEKIKRIITNSLQSEKGKDVLTVIIVVLVGLCSFELGRLSNENGSSGIKIEYPDLSANQSASIIPIKNNNSANFSGKTFFASNRGTKYYSLGCSAGKTIKQENRVYFATSGEAMSAGYTLSSSCK